MRQHGVMKILIGLVLLIGGLVLAFAFPDAEFFWFRGRPLGIVLALIGAFDLFEATRKRS